jgi:hypothetical protein
VKARPVVTGPAERNQVVVKEGLTGTEVLVKQPPEGLKPGDAVRVKS